MSTLSQVFANPLVAVIFTLGLAAIGHKAWEMLKKFREEQDQRAALANAQVHDLNATLCDLKQVVQIWTEKIVAIENLIVQASATIVKAQNGTMKACEAIAIATDKHRETVAAFSKNIFGEQGREGALQKADDAEMDLTYKRLQFQSAGKSAEEAQIMAEEENAHEEAIQLSS